MNVRIADTVNNSAEYIEQLSAMEDAALQRKLRIVREQMQLAFQQHKNDSLELLQLWEEQIITARYIRNEEDKREVKPREKVVSLQQPTVEALSEYETEEVIPPGKSIQTDTVVNQLALF